MLVEQIAVNNSLRNYMYLIACPNTLDAVAIDPLDHALALRRADDLGWTIRGVINTHEHYDHTGGNDAVIAATGATLYAHHQAFDKIANVDVGLAAGDIVQVGDSVQLLALDTPGHTFCHTCLYYQGTRDAAQPPALFCGDTLFNAGVGNCHNGGSPEVMYQTFVEQIFVLPDATKVYPGHDYLENNLNFTLDREPNNQAAQDLLTRVQQTSHYLCDIAMERQVNSFFRLDNAEIIALLQKQFPDIGTTPNAETVFLKLRELRNHW